MFGIYCMYELFWRVVVYVVFNLINQIVWIVFTIFLIFVLSFYFNAFRHIVIIIIVIIIIYSDTRFNSSSSFTVTPDLTQSHCLNFLFNTVLDFPVVVIQTQTIIHHSHILINIMYIYFTALYSTGGCCSSSSRSSSNSSSSNSSSSGSCSNSSCCCLLW
jgi:hypothetical protein